MCGEYMYKLICAHNSCITVTKLFFTKVRLACEHPEKHPCIGLMNIHQAIRLLILGLE